jgi:hypothetical protein
VPIGNYTAVIDEIGRDCGSTHITKQFGESEYSAFVYDCRTDGYCKYTYKKLSECLD